MAFVANGCADLTNGVDEFHTEHPLGRGELDLTRKVVDVLDQRSQNHASTLGGLGTHGVDNAGSEVRVELARHCDVVDGWRWLLEIVLGNPGGGNGTVK